MAEAWKIKISDIFNFLGIFRSFAFNFKQHFYLAHFCVILSTFRKKLISQISNLLQRAMSHHGNHSSHAMVTMTVMIIRMRSDVSVQVISSSVVVTILMVVVQGNGDA